MRGSWNQYNGNFTSNNQHVKSGGLPAAAKKVVEHAGIQPDAGVAKYGMD